MLREAIKAALQATRNAARQDYIGFPKQGNKEIEQATDQLYEALVDAIDPRSAEDE